MAREVFEPSELTRLCADNRDAVNWMPGADDSWMQSSSLSQCSHFGSRCANVECHPFGKVKVPKWQNDCSVLLVDSRQK